MSEMNYVTGKLTKVDYNDDLEKFMLGKLNKNKEDFIDGFEIYDDFWDEFYDNYIIINDILYEIMEKKECEEGDIFLSNYDKNGNIYFSVYYYNGGCSLEDAIEKSLKNIKPYNSKTIWEKDYDGESLYDLNRDISEAFGVEETKNIPVDKHGIMQGIFTVKIIWKSE